MQMDAYLKKEQNGTLFVWVGAPEGGIEGGGGVGGVQPKIWTPPSTSFVLLPSRVSCISPLQYGHLLDSNICFQVISVLLRMVISLIFHNGRCSQWPGINEIKKG